MKSKISKKLKNEDGGKWEETHTWTDDETGESHKKFGEGGKEMRNSIFYILKKVYDFLSL